MKYPKYTRDQDLRYKLTFEDIKNIKLLFRKKILIKKIAKKYNVCYQTINYWLLSKNKRIEFRKKLNIYHINYKANLEKKHKYQLKSVKRKFEIMPEFKQYHKELMQKYRKNNY